MRIIRKTITLQEFRRMAKDMFGDLVKAVVDVEKEIMAVDGELHADEEALLIKHGSKQHHLWGINLYPDLHGEKDFIEFDSMINVRPSQGNTSRGIDDPKLRKRISELVTSLIQR